MKRNTRGDNSSNLTNKGVVSRIFKEPFNSVTRKQWAAPQYPGNTGSGGTLHERTHNSPPQRMNTRLFPTPQRGTSAQLWEGGTKTTEDAGCCSLQG